MANCKECKEKRIEGSTPENVPYRVYEETVARHSMQTKRLIWAIIVAVILLFASNIGWLIYERQFETITLQQDGEGINNVNYGDQGDLNNGAESENQAEEEAE